MLVTTDVLRVEIDTRGANVVSAGLLAYQAREASLSALQLGAASELQAMPGQMDKSARLARLGEVLRGAELHTPYGMTEALPLTDVTLEEDRQAEADAAKKALAGL